MIQKYQKKPVIIEAIKWDNQPGKLSDIIHWSQAAVTTSSPLTNPNHTEFALTIATPEGLMTATIGDYIIKGLKGEFYPCKPDIFEQSYTAVE
jgi:hypothetical protein